jgi:cold shock CspA family protein
MDYVTIGHIVKLVPERGFGFIRPHAGGVDIFFLAKDVRLDSHDRRFDRLTVGQLVRFTPGTNDNGRPRAYRVEPIVGDQQDAA